MADILEAKRSLVDLRGRQPAGRPRGAGRYKTRRHGQEIPDRRLSHLPGRRQKIQIPEAPPAEPLQSLARTVPGEVGLAGGLSHGSAQLRPGPLQPCQTHGAGPAKEPEVGNFRFVGPDSCGSLSVDS